MATKTKMKTRRRKSASSSPPETPPVSSRSGPSTAARDRRRSPRSARRGLSAMSSHARKRRTRAARLESRISSPRRSTREPTRTAKKTVRARVRDRTSPRFVSSSGTRAPARAGRRCAPWTSRTCRIRTRKSSPGDPRRNRRCGNQSRSRPRFCSSRRRRRSPRSAVRAKSESIRFRKGRSR